MAPFQQLVGLLYPYFETLSCLPPRPSFALCRFYTFLVNLSIIDPTSDTVSAKICSTLQHIVYPLLLKLNSVQYLHARPSTL
ncbi:hypothetical protein M378DRAFT_161333 [Amanita muscaria Koide BX008]|uniref:Uncharacterized protein n=1 Tax=Amanita muscaria (strain Koide BX008) TaxID=946122 RepID=A0A0C2X9V6_AMAMK|nr:hypothetical protein M378DRAFT_161333 [Amanita muscaria Koide BX008]